MAYKYTKGVKLEKLLDINPDKLMSMSTPELRETVSRLAQAANKRVAAALKKEYVTVAVQQAERGGKFSTKGKDAISLRNEYIRARNFLNNPLSTVKGTNQTYTKFYENLKNAGFKKIKRKDIPDMMDRYSKLSGEDGTVLTKGEIYMYLREIGNLAGFQERDIATETGRQIVTLLDRELAELREQGEYYNEGDTGVSKFFNELS